MAQPNTSSAEDKILQNIANPAQSYEVDGEKTQLKDPVKQLEALSALKKASVSRHPLGAIIAFHTPSGTGLR